MRRGIFWAARVHATTIITEERLRRMLTNLKKQDILIALIACGTVILFAIKIRNDDRELKRNFVKNCTDYSVRRIQNTCRNLGIDGFEERKPQLSLTFSSYCACLIDVWRNSGIELQPEYYLNIGLPKSGQTDETKFISSWMQSPQARSDHARCQAKARINLNWIPAEINKKKREKSVPKTK